MKVTIELTGQELVLLYLTTGNEDAKAIIMPAHREYARQNPRPRWARKKNMKEATDVSTEQGTAGAATVET